MRKKGRNFEFMLTVNGRTAAKTVFLFIVGLLLTFILSGVLTSLRPELRPSSPFYRVANELAGETYGLILGMENHYFVSEIPNSRDSFQLSPLILKLATSINLKDPRSFLGRELPGFSQFDSDILVAGKGTNYTNMPSESSPPAEVLKEEREANLAELEGEDKKKKDEHSSKQSTGDRKVVFIYNTHNTESYLPFLKGETDPDLALHSKANITLVSDMLGQALESQGVGVSINKTDFQANLKKKGWNYARSYDESRPAIKEAMAKNKNLQYFIDIHRDSQRKKATTTKIGGKNYARIAFVIGKKSSNFEANFKLAKELHERLEKKYPGLSRGVISKGASGDNGVYNQDLNERSILIEFGGVDNNRKELERAADATADVFSEMFWEAEKVDAGSDEKNKKKQ
ncbi:stage II sporulation protein P [Bacillus changyiensis]|uniref:stage II sporulation protein P n=1 Tax=Bacillus changyiensis TaxID=3004103 RepID=UPI0022E6CDB5|nr:stage II sporulation protein P [Bacillus changyiensis]MDA1474775.1 stage II sporulation protein P [Bacillus changyiensis]